MKRGSAVDFLIRTVLDEAFRELAIADPQRAFEGYHLSDEEQEILRSRDFRLLGLLGMAAARGQAFVEPPLKRDSSETAASSLPSLPEVRLLLRLVPRATQPPGSGSRIAYAASLRPWPGDHEPKGTDVGSGEQAEEQNAGTLPEIAWIVRITPTVVGSQEAGLTVAYSASIHPLGVGTDRIDASAQKPTPALASPPWNHHIESSAAKDAARAVRASDASGRYEKLRDLIHALQTGDDRG